jgi:hypothetical protein
MSQRGRRNADQVLLVALACGATIEAAAHKAGVSDTTVYRRLQDPEFQKQLQQFRADMVQRAAAGLTAAAMEAIKTLLALLQSSNTGAVRLGAARAVLELGAKLRETVELEQRIAALEQKSGRTGQT